MSSESDDEPLSVLAALKRDESQLEILPIFNQQNGSSKKLDIKKHCDVSIALQPIYQNELPPVIERPADVWLYLTDFNPTGPYTCLLCSEWFLNRHRIVAHYVINHNKEYCGICRYLVPSREAWWEHQRFHTPWKCSQCEENFETQTELRVHFSEAHDFVHCRFCSLRLPEGKQYHEHLFQKHGVTKTDCINRETLWDFESNGQKFQCLLCLKSCNVGKQFTDHYMSQHHSTLKCFTFLIAGIDLPFKMKGIDLTPQFVETQLKTYSTLGYVEFVKSLKFTKESTAIDEPSITIKCDPDSEKLSDEYDDVDDTKLSEEIRAYKGVKDIDVALLEVIAMQKCYFDYIDAVLFAINSETVPVLSSISYSNMAAELRPINCCFCTEIFMKKSAFECHITRAHSVKALPMFWCRVCAAVFDNYSALVTHSSEEMKEFEDLWICQFCDKEFDGREEARKHLTEHWDLLEYDNCFSPHLGFKCKYCSTLFWNESDRNLHHINVHYQKHKSDFYKCTLCGEVFGDKVFFIHHYQEKHNNDTQYLLKCCVCAIVSETVDEMRAHFEAHHPRARKIFCCKDECQYRPFCARKSFVMHLRNFHCPNPPKKKKRTLGAVNCETCGLEFSSSRACSLHASQAHGPGGKLKCTDCDVALTTADERKVHYILRHPGRAPYTCNQCDRSFTHKSSLYMHKQQHDKKDYTCNFCGKTFMKKDSFREHVLIHEAPRHACSYCPMRFVQRSNMLRHERRHTGERPYACEFCPRTFSDKGACTSHLRTHQRTKSFECAYCGQTFVQKSKLTYHTRKHTGENLETCTICSKMFTSACSLREHMRVHQKQKMKRTVKCPLCKKMYPEQRDMLRHMRSAHTGAQFKCPLCRKTLCSSSSLREHVLTHSQVNTYQCKLCPKSYHVRKSVQYHLEKRHGLKPPITEAHFRHLDPKECGLGLDDDVIDKIFSKARRTRRHTDVIVGDFNSGLQFTNSRDATDERDQRNRSDNDNEYVQESIQVKVEPYDGDSEVAPLNFVNVKIEMEEVDSSEEMN